MRRVTSVRRRVINLKPALMGRVTNQYSSYGGQEDKEKAEHQEKRIKSPKMTSSTSTLSDGEKGEGEVVWSHESLPKGDYHFFTGCILPLNLVQR